MRQRRKKKKKIVKHAKKRMWERTGTRLTKAKHDEIVKKITRGHATLIEDASKHVGIYDVDGLQLVFDRNRKLVITILEETDDYIDPALRAKYMQ